MGFWKPTPISWQVEIWVLGNLYMELLFPHNNMESFFYIEDDEVKITSTNNLDIKLKNEKKKAIVRKEQI